MNKSWLELPGNQKDADDYIGTYYDNRDRNYTHLYDKSTYASLWTAYPLYKDTTGGSRDESWAKNPNLKESEQINIWKGSYGVDVGSTIYARGHLLPDGDRSNNATMQEQTYYSTNMTPQLQNGFNGGVWARLEDAVRGQIPENDTLYVVTGASFRKINENLT